MPSIPLHPKLDLGQYIYKEGRWTPQSIGHRCLEYHYTSCCPSQSIKHEMPCIPPNPLIDLGQCLYIEGRWTPRHCRCLAFRSRTMSHSMMPCIPLHPLLDLGQCIYIEGPPSSIKHGCTPNILAYEVNRAQMIPLHPLLDLEQCII